MSRQFRKISISGISTEGIYFNASPSHLLLPLLFLSLNSYSSCHSSSAFPNTQYILLFTFFPIYDWMLIMLAIERKYLQQLLRENVTHHLDHCLPIAMLTAFRPIQPGHTCISSCLCDGFTWLSYGHLGCSIGSHSLQPALLGTLSGRRHHHSLSRPSTSLHPPARSAAGTPSTFFTHLPCHPQCRCVHSDVSL